MRGRSSKHETKEGMEIDKLNKVKEEPHLSGAYIRSLVKQLTSARTKDPMNPKDRGCQDGDGDGFSSQNITKLGEGLSENQQTRQTQQSQPHKKQVRRRLHTSRPYQERLLNMAEARREIVTALKFHRAAMKQANEQRQQQQQQQQQQQFQGLNQEQQHLQQSSLPISPPCFEQEGKISSRRNPRIYQSSTVNFFDNHQEIVGYPSSSHPPPPYAFPWPTPVLPPTFPDNFNFPLPDQTLGLNLNFHDFNNIETSFYHNSNYPSSIYSTSSPSSSSSPPLSMATEEVPSVVKPQVAPPAMSDVTESYSGGGLHQVMDAEEMAEMRSIGEQHQMEWNDTMNLVTSAWWFKFLKTIDLGPEVKDEDDGYHPYDQVMEFPAWLNANDGYLQQHLNDDCSQDYFHDPALPWLSSFYKMNKGTSRTLFHYTFFLDL